MNTQKCKARPKINGINSNSPMFYPFSIKVNECSGVTVIALMTHMQKFVSVIL